MKKVIVGVYLTVLATMTWASCSTQTYFINGKTIICNVCCIGNSCTTNCF